MAAVNRGLRFEICYSRVLAPGNEARARANFIGNVAQLVRATRGRGLLVSSEAGDALGLRAPADVLNLLSVWGVPREKGTEAIGVNPRGVVVNEGIKRSGFRGVIDIVGLAERPMGEKPAGERPVGGKEKGKGKDNKRKNEEGGNGGGEGDQPMSKRQAKKLRAALRAKEAEGKGAQS